ncbi:MAG: phosphoribosyltransferase family protein [Bacillota bacterium]
MLYRDRRHAGKILAEHLSPYKGQRALVLAVPRGGVVVGDEVATALDAQLDVVITRKIGAPAQPELAIGAVAPDGTVLCDPRLAGYFNLPEDYISSKAEEERKEIQRRLERYRERRPLPEMRGRILIVVDDGIATGLTITAAVKWLRGKDPARLVLAVPVAPPEAISRLKSEVDEVVCPYTPEPFFAVGQFYHVFDQTPDEVVVSILQRYVLPRPGAPADE